MTPIAFTIDITPRSVQHGKRLGRSAGGTVFFSDKKTKAYHAGIAKQAAAHTPRNPLDGPVHLRLAFFMPRPKKRPTRVDNGAWKSGAAIPYETRGRNDLDNLMKGFVDGLEGFWLDDGQIVQAQLSKHYHEAGGAPRVEVFIAEHREAPCS